MKNFLIFILSISLNVSAFAKGGGHASSSSHASTSHAVTSEHATTTTKSIAPKTTNKTITEKSTATTRTYSEPNYSRSSIPTWFWFWLYAHNSHSNQIQSNDWGGNNTNDYHFNWLLIGAIILGIIFILIVCKLITLV